MKKRIWILWQYQVLISFFSVYKIILIIFTRSQEPAKRINALTEQMDLKVAKAQKKHPLVIYIYTNVHVRNSLKT